MNRKKLLRRPSVRLILLLLLCAAGKDGWSQIDVWPGDANNDGIANHLDLLNVGIGFGKQGIPRDTVNTAWQQQQVQDWNETLPDSLNLGYTDCSGNGLVNIEDVGAIEGNYGDTNTSYQGISFLQGGPTDPTLTIIPNGSAFDLGELSFVTIYLDQEPGDSVYGVAFTFEYDTNVVKKATVIGRPHPQFGGGGRQPLYIQKNDTTFGRLEFAVTRINGTNHGGGIAVGNVEFVIEDNLFGKDFLDFANAFSVKRIRMYDKQMQEIPARGDTADAKIATGIYDAPVHSFNIYPVPASDKLFIDNYNNKPLLSVEIIDLRGIMHLASAVQHDWSVMLDVSGLPQGMYVVRLVMKDSVANEKIFIKR